MKNKKGSRTISRVMSSRDFYKAKPIGYRGGHVIYLSGASLCFGARAAYPPAMDEQPIVGSIAQPTCRYTWPCNP